MTRFREVRLLSKAFHTIEGDGFDVQRAIPGNGYESVGPFIFLDHFGPIAWKPGEAKGASSHPHAGIETMTLLLEGRMRHKDSLGNASTMAPGDVQWMRAGRGIVHDEQPDISAMQPGERTHGVQLWLNLPAGGKHVDPRYRHVLASEIPLIASARGAARVRLIAGSIDDRTGPIETGGAPFAVHASFAQGDVVTLPTAGIEELGLYVMLGQAEVGSPASAVPAGRLAWLTPGDTLLIRAEAGTELVVIGGNRLDAPIVRYGPFVMNSVDEIQRAVRDFQAGKMGRIAA
ncbi:pirin [Sphingomonas oleivorans]|uniref:Pirin n=1 Tax=Sphingomonas oleivorans TaxID=1735121 RepID=A0A2T5FZU9_9SPHN|nr:pirin family protein [Sphingomonas oleivorans]PTQ12232.1 pirin [Sphingomonas oleivorans]